MRLWRGVLRLGILPLVSTIAHGACLPTLGTDDCLRGADPVVQAIEHHYLHAYAASDTAKKVQHHKKVVHKDSFGGFEKSEQSDKGGSDKGREQEAVEAENRTPARGQGRD
jgi:hypothetical protein